MKSPYICLNCRLTCLRSVPLRRTFSASPLRRHNKTTQTDDRSTNRPATSPKPVPNVRNIRENADIYSQNCIDRNYKTLSEYPSRIKALAEEAAQLQRSLRAPRSKLKGVQNEISKLASSSKDSDAQKQLDALVLEAKQLRADSQSMTDRAEKCNEEIQQLALSLPNLTSEETPVGNSPRLVDYINFNPKSLPSYISTPDPARNHVTIGTSLGLLDFTSSATSTGWGWYYLTNEGALLEQALVQYAISVAMRRGWKLVSPPTLVYSYIAEACGFQPRDTNDEQQIWAIERSEKDKSKPQRCLTGTAEISLAAMYAGRDIPAEKLPMKLIGVSRCYRAEAGARGVDTKGLYRVHEFTKVELFAWTDNPQPTEANSQPAAPASPPLFSEIVAIQTEILSSLNLPCRILEMPTGDLGASAARKQDIEALFPSRMSHRATTDASPDSLEDGWGEVTSASICTDYQSRRLGTRVRSGSTRFPHSFNGTAVAVPRVIAAILENGWDEERGGVIVPEVLRNWMGGVDFIGGKGS